jgi:Uma2 family endonuclease
MIEFDDGCVEVLPMPSIAHQRLVDFLADALKAFLKRRRIAGDVLRAPLPVRLRKGKYREPDVVFFRPRRAKSPKGQPHGADLVMEVVSEGEQNRERDLVIKPAEYFAAGVAEYWIVDPQQRSITVLTADIGAYRTHGTFTSGMQATSAMFPGFRLDVDAVFKAAQQSTLSD